MPGTIYLHIGHAKTGTSAIQTALVRNRSLLARHGLLYPQARSDSDAEKGIVTSGNGRALRSVLWSPEAFDKISANKRLQERSAGMLRNIVWARSAAAADSARSRLEDFLASNVQNSLIYSSEGFAELSSQALKSLCEIFQRFGFRVKVIYYVRHLLDFALSQYSEQLKRHASTHEIADFIANYRSTYVRVVERFAEVVGKDNIIMRLYDNERANLVTGFFSILSEQEGTTIKGDLIDVEKDVLNRSLTFSEMQIMLQVNKHLENQPTVNARKISRAVSDSIVRSVNQQDTTEIVITPEDMAMVEQNNRHVLEYVNRFVNGAFELKLKSDKVKIGPRARPEPGNHLYQAAIAALMREIVNEREGLGSATKGNGRRLNASM